MASALSNSRTALTLPPVEYPGLSSLTAVGYNYPSCTGPPSAAAHQLVYGAGCRLSTTAPVNPYYAGGGTLQGTAVPDAWGRHHHSPLSFYAYHHQTEADWILHQSSKLQGSAFSHHHHQQQQQQQPRWKDGSAGRRDVTTTSSTTTPNQLASKNYSLYNNNRHI